LTSVLLSIRPEYAKEIIHGRKKYEFRKSTFKKQPVDHVYISASSPIKKLVGTFRVGQIVKDKPKILWDRFGDCSGISKERFFEYFAGRSSAYAIGIDRVGVFDPPIDPMEYIPGFAASQSFYYFDDTLLKGIDAMVCDL